MDLSIIIVSYNTKQLLQECLDSLINQQTSFETEIIVIDNASGDGSAEMVLERFPQVRLIRNQKNSGFGVANNQGVDIAKGEYVLLLNSDTLVPSGTLDALIKKARSNSTELATCCLENPDGSIQPQGGALPTVSNIAAWMLFLDDVPLLKKLFNPYQQRDIAFFKKDHKMGWIGGTAMLIKKSLFLDLGGFDRRIFMYAEDVDLCWRAQKKFGIRPRYFSRPCITHLGQGSSSQASSFVGEFKGVRYLFIKHGTAFQTRIVNALLKAGALLRLVLFGIILKQDEKQKAYHQILKLDR